MNTTTASNNRFACCLGFMRPVLVLVAKRKWGEALSARREAMQQIQALLGGVVYNIYYLATMEQSTGPCVWVP